MFDLTALPLNVENFSKLANYLQTYVFSHRLSKSGVALCNFHTLVRYSQILITLYIQYILYIYERNQNYGVRR